MNGEETIEHGTKEEARGEGRGKKFEVTNLRNTGSKIIKTSPNSNHNNKSSIGEENSRPLSGVGGGSKLTELSNDYPNKPSENGLVNKYRHKLALKHITLREQMEVLVAFHECRSCLKYFMNLTEGNSEYISKEQLLSIIDSNQRGELYRSIKEKQIRKEDIQQNHKGQQQTSSHDSITTTTTTTNNKKPQDSTNIKNVDDDTDSEDDFDILDESHIWFAQLMHRIDSVGDGKISFQQFCVFCTMLKKQWELQASNLNKGTTTKVDIENKNSQYNPRVNLKYENKNGINNNRTDQMIEQPTDDGKGNNVKEGNLEVGKTLVENQESLVSENNIQVERQESPFIISPTQISEKELQEQLYDPIFSHVSTPRNKNI